jgi:hypothetical protein
LPKSKNKIDQFLNGFVIRLEIPLRKASILIIIIIIIIIICKDYGKRKSNNNKFSNQIKVTMPNEDIGEEPSLDYKQYTLSQ